MDDLRGVNLSAFIEYRALLKTWLFITWAALALFIGLLMLSYFVLNSPEITNDSMRYTRVEAALGFGEIACLCFGVLAYFRYTTAKRKYHLVAFQRFLSDNHWHAQKKYDLTHVASILLGAGSAYEEEYAYEGKFADQEFRGLIFSYLATDSNDRRFICLHFKLPKSYPMIVIDNKRNDRRRLIAESNLPERIPNGVDISLEGDFNKYFQISTARGYEREALMLLSPEFMANLIDHANNKVDIEVSGNDLFLIYEASHYSEKNLISLFSTARVTLNKLSRLSKSWLASSKGEEKTMVESARHARQKLLSRIDVLGVAAGLLVSIFIVVLLVTRTL